MTTERSDETTVFVEAMRRSAVGGPDNRRWIYVPEDQLSAGLGPLAREVPETLGIVLIESRWKARRRPYHKQKLALVLALLLCVGCSAIPRRNPTGQLFPSVRGQALDGRSWRLPEDLRGRPALLLVGYKQDSQFDIDRWLLGIEQLGLEVTAIEVPTISGMFPRMFSTRIDRGMRKGIPKALWGGVVTVYRDAARIESFTGSENGLTGRVLLLDASGRVAYFHDSGYSVPALKQLEAKLAALRAGDRN